MKEYIIVCTSVHHTPSEGEKDWPNQIVIKQFLTDRTSVRLEMGFACCILGRTKWWKGY
jgi:hypothetical protein